MLSYVTDSPSLMPIGRFSSLSRITVRMLRHYDAERVLVPAQVDALSGYRSYDAAQLADAAAIRGLRDVGFGVSAIKALLAVRGTAAFDAALATKRVELAAAVDDANTRLQLLDYLLSEKEKLTVIDTVTEQTVPAQTLVFLRDVGPNYAAERQLWERFLPALRRQGIVPGQLCGCIEHDDEFRESDVDESVFVDVIPGVGVQAPLGVLDVPARRAVVATVSGPYAEAIPRAHAAIGAYVNEHGLTFTRTADDVTTHHFNVYLDDPHEVPEDRMRTQVCAPVA